MTPDWDAFIKELGDLGRKHGVAVGGNPPLFAMEPEDFAAEYICDKDGLLVWGGEPVCSDEAFEEPV